MDGYTSTIDLIKNIKLRKEPKVESTSFFKNLTDKEREQVHNALYSSIKIKPSIANIPLEENNFSRAVQASLAEFFKEELAQKNKQINIKLTDEDLEAMLDINKEFFENELNTAALGRLLIRKGIKYYQNLK